MLSPPKARPLTTAALAVAALTAPAAPARADDSKQPYKVRIILHVADHRLLTEVFRQQVARELGDGLRAALGALGTVEVVDDRKKLPPDLRGRLDDVLRRGLGRALDEWKGRTGAKDHFVLVDYAGGDYVVQARQHDGMTGLPSPVVRRDRTRDRAFVARTAALLVVRDLGILGTVTSGPDAKRNVVVQLRGGGLGVPMGRWVKVGDVFALVQVPASGAAGQVVPWSYLQVQAAPRDGTCQCRLITRYPQLSRLVGLRCVKLGTTTAPLRLRLVPDKPDGERSINVTLQVRHSSFEGEAATLLDLPGRDDRDVDTSGYEQGRFTGLAYVTVLDGAAVRARVPVPILDDRLVVLPVPAASEEDNLLGFRVAALRRDVADSYLDQTNLFEEINQLTARPKERARALTKVQATLKRSAEDHDRLKKERDELLKEAKGLSARDRATLDRVEEGLRQLKAGEGELRDHLAHLEKIEREENDPTRKTYREQLQQARLLVKQVEVGRALALYEKLLKEAPRQVTPDVRKEYARLKEQWKPKSGAHAAARRFIYDVWPALDTPAVARRLEEAQTAFKACREAGDLFGPRKLLNATRAHTARLVKEVEALKPDVNIEDDKPLQVIRALAPQLQKLDEEITAYLEQPR
jgi:hypothetical protein